MSHLVLSASSTFCLSRGSSQVLSNCSRLLDQSKEGSLVLRGLNKSISAKLKVACGAGECLPTRSSW